MEKKKVNTAHIDGDGKLYIDGTFNFEGSIVKLKEIIDNVINEYGEDTKCKLCNGAGVHGYGYAQFIITNKKLNNS